MQKDNKNVIYDAWYINGHYKDPRVVAIRAKSACVAVLLTASIAVPPIIMNLH